MNVLSIPIKYKYMLHISLPVFMESCPWTTFVLCKYDYMTFFFFSFPFHGVWDSQIKNNYYSFLDLMFGLQLGISSLY